MSVFGDNDSWSGPQPTRDPISAALAHAYSAGQLAMRERCAKEYDEAAAGIDLRAVACVDLDRRFGLECAAAAIREAAAMLRALSPEEHERTTNNPERNESHG